MATVLQAAKIPLISPTATIPELTGVGDYIFRACFVDDFQGVAMATFAIRDLKAKTAVVLTNTGNKYSMDLAKTFIRQFTQQRGTIPWEGDYLMGSTDLVGMLFRVKAMHPDVIFLPGYVDDSAQIIKLARDKGIRVPILGGDGWDNLMYKTAGSALHGCYYTAQWHKDSANEKSIAFVKSWEKTRGKVESQWVAPAYDAVMLLADAVRKAGASEPAKIRDALAATKGFKGVTGDITFDAYRNPVGKPVVILKFHEGRSVYVKIK
jgi:branched-chain amino acid transport system substrate-binding protein